MTSSASLTVARWGPHVAIVLVVLAALGTVLGGPELGLDAGRIAAEFLLPVGLGTISLALLYQGAFVLVRPRAGIEHDVEPPSQYDTSYETTRCARKIGGLTAVVGLTGLVVVWFVVALTG